MTPYVVEYYNGAFWVHKQREFSYNNKGEKVPMDIGELAWKEPYTKYEDAQKKADSLNEIYYKRIGRRKYT